MNEIGDLYDEACLLADIEVFEQLDRIEAAAKTVDESDAIMVIDHGRYYLDFHRKIVDVKHGITAEWSQRFDNYGSRWMMIELTNRMIGAYNSNLTMEERSWPDGLGLTPFVHQSERPVII